MDTARATHRHPLHADDAQRGIARDETMTNEVATERPAGAAGRKGTPHDTCCTGSSGSRSGAPRPIAAATAARASSDDPGSAAPSSSGPNVGLSCVIHANRSRSPSHSRSTGVGPTPSPNTKRGRPGRISPVWASAKVLPIVGCPAIGISVAGVKIRIRTSVPAVSDGRMNVLSEKFISRASACMRSTARPRASTNTAS